MTFDGEQHPLTNREQSFDTEVDHMVMLAITVLQRAAETDASHVETSALIQVTQNNIIIFLSKISVKATVSKFAFLMFFYQCLRFNSEYTGKFFCRLQQICSLLPSDKVF